MLIQNKKHMQVTVNATDNGRKILCLSERDGYHLQVCILTKRQGKKLADYLLSE